MNTKNQEPVMIHKNRIAILSSGLLFILFLIGCQEKEGVKSVEQKIMVKTAAVILKEISFPITASGVLASPTETKLSFKTGGIIEQILAEEGQFIKKGQLLASLQKSEIEARVQQARSGYEKALRDFQRVSNLYQDSVATLEQKQDAETGLTVARSNLEIAEYNLEHSSIFAPSNGKILKRLAEINELIDTGRPIFVFGSTEGSWRVRTGIPDRDIVKVNYGDSAEISFDAYPAEKFNAVISEIAQAADPYTGTYEVELILLPHDKKLIFGFVADIRIFPRVKESYFLIPMEALTEADGRRGTIFYVQYPENIARRSWIEIYRILDGQVAISHGLENIPEVISEGSPYLRDGSAIEIKN
jgi:multidrug efflux system membrane fusion protein